jgi:hypothetical protein
MRYRFFIFLIAVIFCFDANLLKAQEFDPLSRNGHVSIRTALALRDIRDLKCDGILSDREWQAADPINKLIVGGNQPYLSKNLTFVRIASDANNLYVGAVCFLAPQENIGKQALAWDKDLLTLRLDPGINGRHILQMVFNYKGLESFRDTHESWGFSGRADVTFKGNIFDAKTRELPPLESAKLQQFGSAAVGWCMEAAIPWRYLGNVLQPAEGEVMGLQVSRKTATDEQSFWDRNTFNGFDAQGHIYFVSTPPLNASKL